MKVKVTTGPTPYDCRVNQIMDDGNERELKSVTRIVFVADVNEPLCKMDIELISIHKQEFNGDAKFYVGTKDGRIKAVKKIIFEDDSIDVYDQS